MKLKELFEETINGSIAVYGSKEDSVNTIFPETYKNYFLYGESSLPFDYSNDTLQGSLMLIVNNVLTDFKGVPKIVKGKYQVYTTLEEVNHSPESVYCLDFHDSAITTLQGMPKEVINGNKGHSPDANFGGCDGLSSLEGIGKDYLLRVDDTIILPRTIRSHMLGLIKVQNLERVYCANATGGFLEAINIICHHLNFDRNINKCKSELIEAGLEEFAKL